MIRPAAHSLAFFRRWFPASVFLLGLFGGCHGGSQVVFVNGQCLIDGIPATLAQVDARQAVVSAHILALQPLFVLITVLVVALAGMSHIEKLVLLITAGRADVKGLGERLRVALDRYRAHPVRYFGIVAGTLGLLVLAATTYISLDADKRSSERALGMLQFCHISLRTQGERGVLDEQRHNLETIEATAGDIRALVTKLPPEERRKAQEIIEQMNAALGQQSKLVTGWLQRTDESNRAAREQTMALERGLSAVEAEVSSLKTLPGGLHDLALDTHAISGKLDGVDSRLAAAGGKLDALDSKVGTATSKLTGIEGRFSGLDAKLAACDTRLGALENALRALAHHDKEAVPTAAPVDGGSPNRKP